MNVLILAARGNTGCGDARMAIEVEDYLKQNGDFVKVVEGYDRKWGRDDAQGELDWVRHKFLKGVYSDSIQYDLCLITSVPPKNIDKDVIKANTVFDNLLSTICQLKDKGTRICYLQCDNKISSINRNFYALEDYRERFFTLLDRVIVHNLNADFIKKFIERKVPKSTQTFTTGQQVLISTDFDEVKSLVKESDKIDKSCWFIGRSAQWKGWREFRDLHTKTLKDDNWLSVIEGIELSINAKQDLSVIDENNHYTWRDDGLYEKDQIGAEVNEVQSNSDNFRNKPILIYGPFNRVEALSRVHRSKFGMFFTFTGPEFGGQIEITFLEIVAAGTIPVIRKELYDCAYFNDTYLKDLGTPEDLGILVYDSNNPKELLDKMNELNTNNVLYTEYLNKCNKWCREQFSRDYIIRRLIDKCMSDVQEYAPGSVGQVSLW